ncbi:MAG: response regulator [Steroidobacteraceae bacterium]
MKTLKVLLVEDSSRIAAMLRDLLENETGIHDIQIVADQQSAIVEARQTHYDLMILDLQLRTGTGFGVLEALGPQHPPTIVLTNYALPQYRRRAQELGAEYFLDKSKDLEQLQSIIQQLQASHTH